MRASKHAPPAATAPMAAITTAAPDDFTQNASAPAASAAATSTPVGINDAGQILTLVNATGR